MMRLQESLLFRSGMEKGVLCRILLSLFLCLVCPRCISSQEVGYPEKINFFYPTPIDWSGNNHLGKEYERLMSVYNTHEAFRERKLITYPDDHILLFERSKETEDILLRFNVRDGKTFYVSACCPFRSIYTNLYYGEKDKLSGEIELESV